MKQNNNAFAEVIESSLHTFIAQSWQWDTFPPFGSLVSIEAGKRTIFAVVHQVSTGSMEPNRYPFAYQKTEAELLAEQPQIFSFLKTTFNCLVLGYQEMGTIQYAIAPEPPKIHAFVHPVKKDLLKQFFYQDTYLHVLFNFAHHIINLDELILSLIKQQQQLKLLSEEKLHHIIDTFSLLTGNDYRRLKLFLQRVQTGTQL